MRWQLLTLRGNQHDQAITLPFTPVWIGRGPDCQIKPTALTVSRRHCALVQRQGRLFVTPGASVNGTFVNGLRIEQEEELRAGDQLRIGPLAFKVAVKAAGRKDIIDEDAVVDLLLDEPVDRQPPAQEPTRVEETSADQSAFAWRDTRPDQQAMPPMDWFATESQAPSQTAKAAEQLLGTDPQRPMSLFDFRRKK
jgi:pSer/pThr/pTyr-binding forkhead associated (FHA) protein